ncbi:MAG TPA: DUF4184 family protein [Bacteroidia bacterium]|jgi:hypothetical protein|nr:DUF4184 family protein [Bacteroidia bacterium]
MPFTFSHPAAVLPFAGRYRKYFSLTALTIGSIIPDFEYFFRLRMACKFGHTPTGVFWFDLPLTILFAFIFHLVVRDPLLRNSPKLFFDRFSDWLGFDWLSYFRKNILKIMASAVIGICSHILWDGFTHKHGFFTEHIGLLRGQHWILGYHMSNYGTLQYLSSLVGAIVIIMAILIQPVKEVKPRPKKILRYWFCVSALIVLLAMTFTACCNLNLVHGNLLVCMISSSLLALILSSLFFRNEKNVNTIF